MLGSLELSIFSVNNLMNYKTDTLPQLMSLVAAVFSLLAVIALPIAVYKLCNQHYEALWNPEFYHRYAFMFCEFKLDKKVSLAANCRSRRSL